MNTHKQCLVSVSIAALAIPLSLHAADPPRCNDLFEDVQRLACYDAAFGKPVKPGATSAPVAPYVAPVAATAGAATAAAATTAAAPLAPKAGEPATAAALPETFKSAVVTVGQSADGRFITTLANGQQWVQLEHDPRAEVKVGDEVTFHRMLMGNYSVTTRYGYTTRVKRLQ
jgi:hypothetical protein